MFSVGAHGHINPSLAVIRALVARGHRVTYAIPPSFADTVAATGAEPRTYTTTLPTPDDPDAWDGQLLDHLRLFLANAGRALPQLLATYRDDRPDLILYDPMAYAARALADRWHIPAIQLSPHAVPWDGYEEDLAAERAARPPGNTTPPAHAWLAQTGLGPGRAARRPDRCLALISTLLQPHPDRVDPTIYTFTGPCWNTHTPDPQPPWTRPPGTDRKRLLLISLGTLHTHAPDFYRACIAAFGNLPDWHVILQTGRHPTSPLPDALPANIEAHPWVPQRAVLDQADAFITHAGASSAHEALARGVPMVTVPQAADQFGNAALLTDLGIARHVPKTSATPETLRNAVLSLLNDPALPHHTTRILNHLSTEPGTPQATTLIESALPQPPSPTQKSPDQTSTV
ncbi:macrolide family glycosyltransferase [Streptomyces sp. NPDC057743]|uniref:macrolide family glycosyltransferase n=1 Tax=Streptomyces sp. NPDC057743 TaxID=3346236 RepID=UPI0036A69366